MTYEAWLLDLDGTLVDTEWGYKREMLDAVSAELGCSFDDRQVQRLWHGLCSSRDDLIRSWGLDPVRFWEVFDRLDDPVARAEATYLYDDAAAVAEAAPAAVVTHCPAPITDRVLDHLDVRDWFDAVVCCDDEVGWKPDPAPVHEGLRAVGADPADAVLVGDSESDVAAAWNAGCEAVHVERFDPVERGQCVLGDRRVTTLEALRPTISG